MSRDSLTQYFDEIGRYPLLTAFQEIELARQIRRMVELRDRESKRYTKAEKRALKLGAKAKEKLMRHNLRLVVYVARKFCSRLHTTHMEMADYIQEGALGLARACEMFDHTKGYKFSTYAYWWIKQSLRRANDNQSRIIRLPVHITERLVAIHRFKEAFQVEHQRAPTLAEVAAEIEVSEEWTRVMLDRCRPTTSLDTLLTDSDMKIIEVIADPNCYTIDEMYEEISNQELSKNLHEQLAMLSEREREAVIMRFGLEPGADVATLDTIGKRLGVSRERSRQIVKTATMKIRRNLALQRTADAPQECLAA